MTLIQEERRRDRAPLDRRLRLAVVGLGARGAAYAAMAVKTGNAEIVAIADAVPARLRAGGASFGVSDESTFDDWRDLAARERLADAVIIALPDALHHDAALAFVARGYDILLEKPMATSEWECADIVQAARDADVLLALCHVMRYTRYTKALQRIIAEGAIGEISGIEHLEPIGYYHYAHSYVRGNWRNEAESSPLVLAKSVHDLDWLSAIVGRDALRVSSAGALTHFREENAPAGSSDRCVSCVVERNCPFSAIRIYREGKEEGGAKAYFARVAAPEGTPEALERALAEGPYGRCVYRSDNDVADQQSVLIEYEGGITVSFTLSAFTPLENRHTRIFGSRGSIVGDGSRIEIYDFLTERRTIIDTAAEGASAAEGHGGGDEALVIAFVDALRSADLGRLVTTAEASLQSHRLAFATERARKEGIVVAL